MNSKEGVCFAHVPFIALNTSYLVTSEGYHYQNECYLLKNASYPPSLCSVQVCWDCLEVSEGFSFATLSASRGNVRQSPRREARTQAKRGGGVASHLAAAVKPRGTSPHLTSPL